MVRGCFVDMVQVLWEEKEKAQGFQPSLPLHIGILKRISHSILSSLDK